MILTTHDMQDIEAIASRIILIGKGKILLDGTLDLLKKRHSDVKRIIVDYDGGEISELEGIAVKEQLEGRVVLEADTKRCSISEAISQISSQLSVTDLSVESDSIEDIVVSLYQEYQI